MQSILLVEDAPEYTLLVKQILGTKYDVHVAPTLAQARSTLKDKAFDLIILDVGLPDGIGFDFYNEIQNMNTAQKPSIIFLSGRGEVQDRVTGWSLGADDYITKPFSPTEFSIRVQNRMEKQAAQKETEKMIRWHEVTLNLGFNEVHIQDNGGERKLDLTPIEFKLLFCFLKSPERNLTRTQLIEAAWGNTHVEERTVDKHISSLRQKLNSEKVIIKTISGMGYRLVHA